MATKVISCGLELELDSDPIHFISEPQLDHDYVAVTPTIADALIGCIIKFNDEYYLVNDIHIKKLEA